MKRALHGIEGLVFARQDRGVQQIALLPIKYVFAVLLDIARRAGTLRKRSRWRPQCAQRHSVQRERAGLVDAQHARGAERFDRVRPAREHAMARHAPGAKGEKHREHDWELFRQRSHRQRHASEHALQPAGAQAAV